MGHHELCDRVAANLTDAIHLERELRAAIRAASEPGRSDLAWRLLDAVENHPDLPPGYKVTIGKLESYFAHVLRIPQWQADWATLMAEAAELEHISDWDIFSDWPEDDVA